MLKKPSLNIPVTLLQQIKLNKLIEQNKSLNLPFYGSAMAGLLASVLLTSCASLPVGQTPATTQSNQPSYPTNYGVPVTERTISQRLLDRSIEHTASVNIKALDPNLSETSRLSVDSFYSDVLLTGEVPTEALKSQVAAIVSSMPDVRQVYDELKVAPNRGYSSTLQDGYITSKFMAKVLASNGVKSSQVKAVTDNGVLYIMGRMTPTQQSHLIDIANQTVGITELVLLTTLLNDNGQVLTDQDVMHESNLEAPTIDTPNTDAGNQAQHSQVLNHGGTPSEQPAAVNYSSAPINPVPVNPVPVNSGVRNSSSSSAVDVPPGTSPYIDLYRDQVIN
ncbi:BON domain-containing protein [Psychrobacter pygoscelis]|uniref:BON domain-containing protein n=1 Tax=Psychrobacter pygoscelis TaxID=2488563 RepID=UPI001F601E16|nr:BON domain-containing protein [Psychrobacter pygoscelis]